MRSLFPHASDSKRRVKTSLMLELSPEQRNWTQTASIMRGQLANLLHHLLTFWNAAKLVQSVSNIKNIQTTPSFNLTLIFEAILRDAKLCPTKSKLPQRNHVLKETTQPGPEVRTPAAKVGNGRTWINFVNSIQVALLAIAGYCRRFLFPLFFFF